MLNFVVHVLEHFEVKLHIFLSNASELNVSVCNAVGLGQCLLCCWLVSAPAVLSLVSVHLVAISLHHSRSTCHSHTHTLTHTHTHTHTPAPESRVRTDLESPGKGHRSWKTLEKSWNSKVVVLEILILVQVSWTWEEIHCKTLCAITFWVCLNFSYCIWACLL